MVLPGLAVLFALVGALVVAGVGSSARTVARQEALLQARALARALADDSLQGQVERLGTSPGGLPDVRRLSVVDAEGHVVASTDPHLRGTKWTGTERARESVTEVAAGEDTPRAWRITMPMETPAGPGTLEIVVGDAATGSILSSAGVATVLGTLATLGGLALVLVLVLQRLVSRPMHRLAEAVSTFRTDQPAPELPVGDTDEVRALMAAFGEMAGRLRGYTARLERDVDTRTRELRHAYERLAVANLQLQEIAVTDALTGLANRRAFADRLDIEAERVRRVATPLSLILFDLDHFKQVNDTHGHPAGDQVLVALASILRDGRRGMDLVARYGGEEFAVLLPETPYRDALLVAERLRASVEAAELTGRVTVSAGIATLPDHASGAEGLVAAADLALYAAKAAGRNRVQGAAAQDRSAPAGARTA